MAWATLRSKLCQSPRSKVRASSQSCGVGSGVGDSECDVIFFLRFVTHNDVFDGPPYAEFLVAGLAGSFKRFVPPSIADQLCEVGLRRSAVRAIAHSGRRGRGHRASASSLLRRAQSAFASSSLRNHATAPVTATMLPASRSVTCYTVPCSGQPTTLHRGFGLRAASDSRPTSQHTLEATG